MHLSDRWILNVFFCLFFFNFFAESSDNNLQNHVQSGDSPVQLKLLCGADLLESFAVPGLWKEPDVRDSPDPISIPNPLSIVLKKRVNQLNQEWSIRKYIFTQIHICYFCLTHVK